MGVSKVNFGNQTLIDLTSDTVTAESLAEGVTAHGADGEPIRGTGTLGSDKFYSIEDTASNSIDNADYIPFYDTSGTQKTKILFSALKALIDTDTKDWASITGKPSTFAPASHTHLWADITDKPSTFTPAAHTHSYITSRGNVTCETTNTRPAVDGLSTSCAYNNGYPDTYGNVITIKGTGDSQLFLGWSGTSGAHAPVYVRSRRDTASANWSAWAQVYTSAFKPSKSDVGLGNVANYDQSKAIKAITRSGTTFTYTCLDGTTGTFTQQDNNTTYNFSGTTFYSGNKDTSEHNANNCLKNGHYYYTSNGPATSLGATTNDGALYVQSYSDIWVAQIAQDYRNGRLFVRSMKEGAWQNWAAVYDTAHKPSWSDIGGIPNTTLAADSGTATINLAANTTYKLTAAGKSVIFKTPADANSDHYTSAYCNTDGATAAKVASCSNFALLDKSWILVVMKNSNTVQGAITLNINSTGAKPIGINGTASSASNYTLPAGSYIVGYGSGTYWFRTDGKLPGSISGNAANVTGTVAIANGGTGATTRLAAAKALTNESVGSSANYFVTLTTNWGKFGYTSVADAKSVLGISVTNKAATLSWGSAATVATVCGTDVTVKLPSNPNTDANVKQGSTNTLNWRKVVLGYQDSTSAGTAVTEQTNQIYVTPNIEAQSATGFLKFKGMKPLITGSGTAGQDKGSGVSPRYFPAKWTFNLGRDASDGDVIYIKTPVAGHAAGVFISIDNGSHYRPICTNGKNRLTTHYPVGHMIMLMYDAAAVTNTFALAGSDGGSDITGSWRVVNYYDSGNTTYSITTWSGGNGPTVSSFVQNTAKGTLMSIFRFRDDKNIFGLGKSGWVKGWVIYQNSHNSAYDVEGYGMVWSNSKGERRYRFHVGGQEKNSSAYYINRVFQEILPEITPSLTKALSTSGTTEFTFSNSLITTNSTVDVYTSIWGVNPSSVTVSNGSVKVVIPKYKSADSLTVKLHIYNY